MTRMSLFNSPFLLGFDQLERAFDRVSKASADGYPPYNIERIQNEDGADHLRITLAVAGFCEDDLDISVEEKQLIIRGKQADEANGGQFLHRGIAARQFQRAFVLADGVEVTGANLENGLLAVDLIRKAPEQIVRKVKISTP